jgi:two-component system sensor histidine kinase FlrB
MSATYPIPPQPSSAIEGLQLDHPLARAFASFTEAAGSLERSYAQLQTQVVRLRQDLEVTNRELANSLEENRRIRERQRRILEGLPCGVLVMESGTAPAMLNPEAERLTGVRIGGGSDLPPTLLTALDEARDSGQECELSLPTIKSDSLVWMAVRHAWLERSPEHSTSVFILRDLGEAKKLEMERERIGRQQALVEMSALLAHEIRNPLGSLELFAGLLAEARLEGENHRWIEHMQAGLRTLSATVNNVLHLYNTPLPESSEMDVGQLIDWAHDFLLPLARQAQVGLQADNGLRGVMIRADRHRLEQVLLNLALNAFRFMPGGGWLGIQGLNLGADGVEIAVRDTGPGIADHDLPNIFQAGYSTRPGSCGLGLAVCRKILEQHGGRIVVESRAGYGATFRLHLPHKGGVR